jgi:hypothetical protein
MSNSKSYNSIVFLTTLYLGLVLVGAAPPVLAQAALTQRIEIQNEIETDDDLDKKPDDGIENKDDFPSFFTQLLIEIKTEVAKGKISLPLQANLRLEAQFKRSAVCSNGSINTNISNKDLSSLVQNALEQKLKLKAFELAGNDQEKNVKISLKADSADLLLEVSFSKNKANQFAEFLNEKFSSSAALAERKLLKKVYENTKAASENNQVFIVTRLPRASIDDFLAENNAQ